jgi:hypothetical protein
MAMAFSPMGGEGVSQGSPFGGSSFGVSSGESSPDEMEPEQSRFVGSKPQPMKGDFNPKELAEGIRTVLSKDK